MAVIPYKRGQRGTYHLPHKTDREDSRRGSCNQKLCILLKHWKGRTGHRAGNARPRIQCTQSICSCIHQGSRWDYLDPGRVQYLGVFALRRLPHTDLVYLNRRSLRHIFGQRRPELGCMETARLHPSPYRPERQPLYRNCKRSSELCNIPGSYLVRRFRPSCRYNILQDRLHCNGREGLPCYRNNCHLHR